MKNQDSKDDNLENMSSQYNLDFFIMKIHFELATISLL